MDPGEKLVRMANQIADFFRAFPRDQAIAGIHEHIVAFWSPAMRRDFTVCLDNDASGIDPLVVSAFLDIASGKSPASKAAAGPAEVGQIGASDAG